MSQEEDSTTAATPLDSGPRLLEVGTQIAHYTIRSLIGRGGFGVVYLAFDETLRRDVALKLPHPSLITSAKYSSMYLQEAQAIASLDHPHIIPVYYASKPTDSICYIVTKFIDGLHLGQWARRSEHGYGDIARVIASIADALAYAHRHGIVHRDIKPSNVLIDRSGHPFVADFGLALRDADVADNVAYVGTAPYMSPEQARGEGHRVDGRSDIFSLGIVLYELLTGQRPFRHSDRLELYRLIQFDEPTPPRQLRPSVPRELERICLKALSKSRGERYPYASIMADELRDFALSRPREAVNPYLEQTASQPTGSLLDAQQIEISVRTVAEGGTTTKGSDSNEPNSPNPTPPNSGPSTVPIATPTPTSNRFAIVPKGLRAFDFRDAEFFIHLLPGPRDRDGLPEVIRFWKSRIEPDINEISPSVGILFGPSGCGKSSLVRAGIIPRLNTEVVPIYVEATAATTESDILEQLMQRTGLKPPDDRLPIGEQLVQAFTWLRRNGVAKTVLFIDQFEQWLFANPQFEREALTNALRQCDGGNLQCILMVRDDFWMGVTRLMQLLELTIHENQNCMAVDLFDRRHAKRVLAMFGAAFGRIDSSPDNLSPSDNRFLEAAVDYLAVENRVVCVQLALLAEILKGRSWTLREVSFQRDGLGLGVRFLNDTFDSDTAQRRLRVHAEAAARVLRRLLPDSISRIKGTMRSEQELIDAAGYTDPSAFRELMRILDNELHLITPTDRMPADQANSDVVADDRSRAGFQLTHDFLITPLRQWLELRNLGTRSGRAQARLDEFAELYQARPRTQSLPTFLQYFNLRFHIPARNWSEPQRRVMRAAGQLYARYTGYLSVILLVLFGGGWGITNAYQSQISAQQLTASIDRLLSAEFQSALSIAEDILRSEPRARERLMPLTADTSLPLGHRARAALVTARNDVGSRAALNEFLLSLETSIEDAIRLCASGQMLDAGQLLHVWKDKNASTQTRLRAAMGLASQKPIDANLESDLAELAALLANEPAYLVSGWGDGFITIGDQLVAPLARLFRDPASGIDLRNNCSLLLGRFGRNNPRLLASLVAIAEPSQLPLLITPISGHGDALDVLRNEIADYVPTVSKDLWITGERVEKWWGTEPRDQIDAFAKLGNDVELVESLKALNAIIAPPSVVLHRVPMDEFESIQRGLQRHGVRLSDLRCFSIDDKRYGAATWIRDGRSSEYLADATSERLREKHQALVKEGFFPSQVSFGMPLSKSSPAFSAVWTHGLPLAMLSDSEMYIAIPESQHQALGWQPLLDRGFVPRTNVVTEDHLGERHYTSIRFKLKEPIRHEDRWWTPEPKFRQDLNDNPEALLVQGDPSGVEPIGGQFQWSAIRWSGPAMESKWIPPSAEPEHHAQAIKLLADGYRIIGFSPVSIPQGSGQVRYASTWWRPLPTYADRTHAHLKQARRLLGLHLLGDSKPIETAMADENSTELRANVIDLFHKHQLPIGWLLERLQDGNQPIVLRRAAGMALALYDSPLLKPVESAKLSGLIQSAPELITDPGMRSVLESICTRWKLSERPLWREFAGRELNAPNQHRMVILQSQGPVLRGSPNHEEGRDQLKEMPQRFILDRKFALDVREITIEQYKRFDPTYEPPEEHYWNNQSPAIDINWFQATRYCRWLSIQDGIPEDQICYPESDQMYGPLTLSPDLLNRTGYRLPTESEWEIACRAATFDARYFGSSGSGAGHLLDNYAWTFLNSNAKAQPVGHKLPNEFGFFDMLGNCLEWCHDRGDVIPWHLNPMVDNPVGDELEIDGMRLRVSRGGSFLHRPLDSRAGQRSIQKARDNRVYMSFRVARTIEALSGTLSRPQ